MTTVNIPTTPLPKIMMQQHTAIHELAAAGLIVCAKLDERFVNTRYVWRAGTRVLVERKKDRLRGQ